MSPLTRWTRRAPAKTSVRLTAVTTRYEQAVPLRHSRQDDCSLLTLAWARKTETVLTDEGDVWSRTVIDGPGVDCIPVEPGSSVPAGCTDVSITFPTILTQVRNTLCSTGPGLVDITQKVPLWPQHLDAEETLAAQ